MMNGMTGGGRPMGGMGTLVLIVLIPGIVAIVALVTYLFVGEP
jgi:hypothetical protein